MRLVATFLLLLQLAAQSASLVAYRTHWACGEYQPAGSLAHDAATSLINLAAARPGLTDQIFTYTPAWWNVTNCTRNTNFWLKDVRGVSSFSATRDGETWYDVPATLVTRRHVYLRGHGMASMYFINRAQKLDLPAYYFIGTNNAVHRAVITNALVTQTSLDYTIGILSEDVPQSVETMRFVTNTFTPNGYISSSIAKWPMVRFCQHRRASGYQYFPDGAKPYVGPNPFPGWNHEYHVGGDSGSPYGIVLDNEFLMSLGATTTGWSQHMQETVDILTLAAGLNTNDYQLKVRGLGKYAKSGGTTNVAASASQFDVAAAIAATPEGPTNVVLVPAGSANWSSLTLSKSLQVVGAGSNSTIITLTGNNTLTKDKDGATYFRNMQFTKSGGGNESKGFTVQGAWSNSPVVFQGCHFIISNSGLFLVNTPGGFIVNNCGFVGGQDDSFIQPKNLGDPDGSWITDSTLGTADPTGRSNIYVEHSRFYGGSNQGIDADDATRVVFRHNWCEFMSFNSHGLDTSGEGVRHWEVYGNTFTNYQTADYANSWSVANQNWAIWIRGGTGVIFSNYLSDVAISYWGASKPEGKFDIRAQQDNSGSGYGTTSPPTPKYSAGTGIYPRERQLGQSWSSAGSNAYGLNGGNGDYITDPICVWGNTGPGSTGGWFKDFSNNTSWGGGNSASAYFVAGRDYTNAMRAAYSPLGANPYVLP